MKIKQFPVVLSSKKSYIQRIIETNPIVYFPMNETSGTAVVNYGTLGTSANGVYTGVTLQDSSAPGGTRCPYWDGTNDYLIASSEALNTNLDRAEFTMTAWAKVNFLWTATSYKEVFGMFVNNNNRCYFLHPITANKFQFIYNGNNASTKVHEWTISTTDWFHIAVTISVADNKMHSYINGVQWGTPATNIVAFVGNPITTAGADQGNISKWTGWIAHCAIHNRPLTATEVYDLYSRGV